MKAITKNLICFAIFFFIGAIVFRYGLSYSLENRLFNHAWIIGVTYFFFNFTIGWFFGKKDYESLPLYDIGFRFHFVTYLLFNIVSISWFLLGFHSQFENIRSVYSMAHIWGIFLFMHYLFYLGAQRKSIKGLNKEDLFE